jgi:hypothetical protein
MSTTNEQDAAGDAGRERATLAGLAREGEQLRRGQDELRRDLGKHAGRIDELAGVVKGLADALNVTGPSTDTGNVGAPSWLVFDPGPADDVTEAGDILTSLAAWVAKVYLRYGDAKLPDCWLWHPDVVEELLWLQYAHGAAYDPDAAATAVGDWHDRQRPGVVTRIKLYVGFCSLEAHQPGQDRALPGPAAPTTDAIGAIAAWWATHRDKAGPAPTAEQVETARQRISSRGRR